MVLTQNEACWAWCATHDDGSLIASCAIVKDGARRGWLIGYPAHNLENGADLLPLIKRGRILMASGAFDELRCWTLTGNERARRFAERFGLAYDCGPARGYSYAGRDLNLHLWRRSK